MSNETEQRGNEIRETVSAFAAEFWQRLTWQLDQMVPGAAGNLPLDIWRGNILERTMEPREWLLMARYGAGLIDADPAEMYEICQSLAEWLFVIPDLAAYSIPNEWADSAMGALWWAAYVRSQGDELIPLAEAAEIAGVSLSTLASRVNRGAIQSFTDPGAPNPRKGRRLVRRSDIAPAA